MADPQVCLEGGRPDWPAILSEGYRSLR